MLGRLILDRVVMGFQASLAKGQANLLTTSRVRPRLFAVFCDYLELFACLVILPFV